MLEKIEKPEIETAELKSNGTYGKFILEPLADTGSKSAGGADFPDSCRSGSKSPWRSA